MKNIVYAGPSWANRSFDEDPDAPVTNLLAELDLTAIDVSRCAAGNLEMLGRVYEQIVRGGITGNPVDGIVWVYCEPLVEMELAGKDVMQDFLVNTDWDQYWSLNDKILDLISSIGLPVALIGAHADITQTKARSNITVIHDSWQRYLVDSIGYDYLDGWKEPGWGAEITHSWTADLGVNPSPDLARRESESFMVWSLLQEQGLWYVCHPTYTGTQMFANEIRSNFETWRNG